MNTNRTLWAALFGLVTSWIALLPQVADANPPAAPPFAVDPDARPDKEWVKVAADAAGNVISAFSTDNHAPIRRRVQTSYPRTLYVVRRNAAGAQIGQPIVVDDRIDAGGYDIAADAAGNFMVVWTHLNGGNNPFYTVLQARRFDTSGTPRGPVFAVATDLIGVSAPTVAMNATGEAVVSWSYFSAITLGFGLGAPERGYAEIHARRFGAAGLPRGGQITVRRNVYDNQKRPNGRVGSSAVAINPAGAFAVSWLEDAVEGSAFMARRYSAAAAALGDSFVVDPSAVSARGNALGLDAAGNLLLAWTDAGVVQARRYDSTGTATGPRLAVSPADRIGDRPIVLMNPSGDAAVAWNQQESAYAHLSPFGRFDAQRFDASGARFGAIFQVDDAATDLVTAIAGSPDGSSGFVFAYILSAHAADGFYAQSSGDLYAARCCTP